ncbi:MAG: hypothetical protein DLM69_01505 [Candidatus Chloroheliales bacterium]|nr:MAG: hypothetical protein DLM69_01505 [Chloroflexota bacterium]
MGGCIITPPSPGEVGRGSVADSSEQLKDIEAQEVRKAQAFDIELLIARVLRVGVFTSAALLAFGLIIYLVQEAWQARDWHTTVDYVSKNNQLYKLGNLIPALFAFEPLAFVEAGVILLILTPIIRVATSVLLFARERDLLYVAITVLVLVVLLFGWFAH